MCGCTTAQPGSNAAMPTIKERSEERPMRPPSSCMNLMHNRTPCLRNFVRSRAMPPRGWRIQCQPRERERPDPGQRKLRAVDAPFHAFDGARPLLSGPRIRDGTAQQSQPFRPGRVRRAHRPRFDRLDWQSAPSPMTFLAAAVLESSRPTATTCLLRSELTAGEGHSIRKPCRTCGRRLSAEFSRKASREERATPANIFLYLSSARFYQRSSPPCRGRVLPSPAADQDQTVLDSNKKNQIHSDEISIQRLSHCMGRRRRIAV